MIILTGGAGFIGSCLLKRLNDDNINDIIVVDNLAKSDKWKNLIGKKYFDYIERDQFQNEIELHFAQKIDAVIHLGACTDTTEDDVNYLIKNNFEFSKNLFNICREKDIKFIYASSAATYGLGEFGYADELNFNLRPLNAYGFSKMIFDNWIESNFDFNNTFGIKFFNVFGPNEYHKGGMASMVYKSFLQIQSSGKVKLFQSNHPDYIDGGQKRDFIYVKDVVEVLYKIYKYSTPNLGGIYNLGTGTARTWNDLVNSVYSALDRETEISYVEMPDNLKKQYQNFTEANMDKLNSTSEFKIEFTSLEDSIKDYVCNYLVNDWQYL